MAGTEETALAEQDAANGEARPFAASDLDGLLAGVEVQQHVDGQELARRLRVAAEVVQLVATAQEARPVPLPVADMRLLAAAAGAVLDAVNAVFANLAFDGQSWAVLPGNQPGALEWDQDQPRGRWAPFDPAADPAETNARLVALLRGQFSDVGADLDVVLTGMSDLGSLLSVVQHHKPTPAGEGDS